MSRLEKESDKKMKTLTSAVLGLSLTLAAAGLSFAAQAPATTPAADAAPSTAPTAKKHVKKNKKSEARRRRSGCNARKVIGLSQNWFLSGEGHPVNGGPSLFVFGSAMIEASWQNERNRDSWRRMFLVSGGRLS